jgi:hypothetical protein
MFLLSRLFVNLMKNEVNNLPTNTQNYGDVKQKAVSGPDLTMVQTTNSAAKIGRKAACSHMAVIR